MEEIISWLIFKPLMGFLQAIMGTLHPTASPSLIRAKRIVAIFVLLGVCVVFMAFILLYLGTGFWTCLLVFTGGILLLSIAGTIGSHIESKAKDEHEAGMAHEHDT